MSWLIEPHCCPHSSCFAGAGVEGLSLFLVWGMGWMGTSGHLCRLRALCPLPAQRRFGPALKCKGLPVCRQRATSPRLAFHPLFLSAF